MAVPTPHAQFRQNVAQGIMFMCLAILIMPVMNGMAKSLTVDHPVAMVVWARFTGHLVAMTLVFWPSHFRVAPLQDRTSGCATGPVRHHVSSRTDVISAAIRRRARDSIRHYVYRPLDRDRAVCPFLGRTGGHSTLDRGNRRLLRCTDHHPTWLRYTGFRRDGTWPHLATRLRACPCGISDMTRKLSELDSAETMIVYMPLTGAIAMSCAMPFVGVIPEGWSNWTLFILVGVLGGFTQYFVRQITRASARIRGFTLSLRRTPSVAAIVGFAIFGDFPDTWTWGSRRHCGERHLYCLSRRCIEEP